MKKYTNLLIISFFVGIFLQGCDIEKLKLPIKNSTQEINYENKKIRELIKIQNNKINKMKSDIDIFNSFAEKQAQLVITKWTTSNINQGFKWNKVGELPITISLKDIAVTSSINNYKLTFLIGNPNFIDISGLKLMAFHPPIKPTDNIHQINIPKIFSGDQITVEINIKVKNEEDLKNLTTIIFSNEMKIEFLSPLARYRKFLELTRN